MTQGRKRQKPVAVLDIGSNSIRLVVYDGNQRTPLPLFNEKAVCALGEGLGASGRLNPSGVDLAYRAIARYVRLARAMNVERLDILATAAVRDAADGHDFVERLERDLDAPIKILSGGQEAKLAAQGVLCGIPSAQGIVADLGGGSCELVVVGDGKTGKHITLPLGVLRLTEASGGNRAQAAEIIDRHLSGIGWLNAGRGQSLYASGGAWRAVARLCIAQSHHPLRILDNYALERSEAERLMELIASQSRKSIEKIANISKKRVPMLPLAALILGRILSTVKPARLVFSVYGMREGQFFKHLPQKLQEEDPLLAACRSMAHSAGRFEEHGTELLEWMDPLFTEETPAQRRIRHAACLLGDVFWVEHPDYRAKQGFFRTLRISFVGVEHPERARLAMTIYHRYNGPEDDPAVNSAIAMLTEDDLRRARTVGLALRLAHGLTGGVPDLIRRTALGIEGRNLVLTVPANDPALCCDAADRPFDRLAKAVGCDGVVVRKI